MPSTTNRDPNREPLLPLYGDLVLDAVAEGLSSVEPIPTSQTKLGGLAEVDCRAWPIQWQTWLASNITDADGQRESAGQYLNALKGTRAGDRLLVLEGESDRGAIGIVDFTGDQEHTRGSLWDWGAVTWFPEAVTNDDLRDHQLLATAFTMRAGQPKHLRADVAEAIGELLGGFPPLRPPSTRPTESDIAEVWPNAKGRPPEGPIEDRFRGTDDLWTTTGFTVAPTKERLSNRKVPDLLSRVDGIVGDVKNEITVHWGPDQLEEYLDHLNEHGPRADGERWRGVLVHGARLSGAARQRLEESPHRDHIQVWGVDQD